MAKVNAGNQAFIDALSLFDNISEVKAKFLAPKVTNLIAAGKTNKQIAAYIASQTTYEDGWTGAWKYDAVEEWIDITRQLQEDEYNSSTVAGVKTPNLMDSIPGAGGEKDGFMNVGLGIAAAVAAVAGLAWWALK